MVGIRLKNNKSDIAKYIDHTALKPDMSETDIVKLCEEALKYGFASVCVNPIWVKKCSEILSRHKSDNEVKICSVIGFPLGASTINTKRFESKQAIEDGASEIDMVINISALKNGDISYLETEISEIVAECKDRAILKVIIETCLITDDEKRIACEIAKKAGADFVKTSTGFSTGGASVHDVELMRNAVGANMGVKASGGIRDYDTAIKMIEAGANRIGASASVNIINGG